MSTAGPTLETAFPGFEDAPVIGILRRLPPELVPSVADAAFGAGLRYLEVTMDSEDALGVISKICKRHQGVGVGSVTRPEQVVQAREAGAEFVVSPITHSGVIATAADNGMAALPGASTPSEIDLALRSGATAVKVFPAAQLGGPDYIRAIMSPLGNPPLIPTGGISSNNAAAYLRAGAVALGVGGSLFSAEAIAVEGVGSVAGRTSKWLEAVS